MLGLFGVQRLIFVPAFLFLEGLAIPFFIGRVSGQDAPALHSRSAFFADVFLGHQASPFGVTPP